MAPLSRLFNDYKLFPMVDRGRPPTSEDDASPCSRAGEITISSYYLIGIMCFLVRFPIQAQYLLL